MTNVNSNEMTREGYEALEKELETLVTETRQENAARLKEAISYGDISENSEYDAAKDAQAETEERITEIEAMLRTAVVVDQNDSATDSTTVQTGRTIRVKDLEYDEEYTYKIVGSSEADPFEGKLSNASLVGMHLIGNKVGDIVTFEIPDGVARYEILEVK